MADISTEATESQLSIDGNATQVGEAEETGGLSKTFRTLGWVLLGLFLVVLFTILKLPEDRVRNYVQSTIASMLSAQDIGFASDKSYISIGMGVSYTMKGITLTPPAPQEPVHIDTVTVSPSLLGMLAGKVGGTAKIYNKDGTLTIHYAQSMSAKNGNLSLTFDADRVDMGSIGLLSLLAGVKGGGVLNGSGSIDGDPNVPSTLTGDIQIDLSKVIIDQQTVMGFQIPRISVSEGKANLVFDRGKATIKTLRLGKPGNPGDDIHANLTGEMVLGRSWPTSTMDVRADFSLSQNILKPLFLLDALIGPGKQPDGSYIYTIRGPLSSLNPMPVSAPAAGR